MNFLDRACGLDTEVKAYPYIYFATPFLNLSHRTTCVKECPPGDLSDIFGYKLQCAPNSVIKSCSFAHGNGDLSRSLLIYKTMPCKTKFQTLK